MDPIQSERLYAWVSRSEVVYLQAIFDAYEGWGRVRTERHEGDRSLLLFLVTSSQKSNALDLLRQISTEIVGGLEWVANPLND
jgi:hypothetical protein